MEKDGDFKLSVLDEIALEGLDGITLPSLWLRLGVRKGFAYKMEDRVKPYLWQTAIVIQSELEFYHLPEPRPQLQLPPPMVNEEHFTDFKFYDDNTPKVYPFVQIDTKDARGSCSTFYTRKNVTSKIRDKNGEMLVNLQQVEEAWDLQRLAIVASQAARTKALVGTLGPERPFGIKQYCLLEIIGRTRAVGNFARPLSKLSLMNEDSKTSFYLRKDLLELGVIAKQAVHINHSFGTLLHLKRFFTRRHSKIEVFIEKAIKILESSSSRSEDYLKVCQAIGVNDVSFKKMLKKHPHSGLVLKEVTVDADPSTTPTKSKSKGKKILKTIELAKPVKKEEFEEEEMGEEEVEKSVDKEGGKQDFFRTQHNSIMKAAFNYIMTQADKGTTVISIAKILNLHRLAARVLVKNMEKQKLVVSNMRDIGRQRVTVYIATPFASKNQDQALLWKKHKEFLESMQAKKAPSIKQEAPSPLPAPASMTARQLKRANIICEAVKQARVIEGVFKIEKLICNKEKKEGIEYRVDKNSVNRLLEMLHKEGLIKLVQTVISYNNKRKTLQFVCEPNMQTDDPLFKAKIGHARLRIHSYSKEDLSRVKREQKVEMRATPSVNQLPKPQPWLKLESKFGRMRLLHQYLFYLIYEYQGDVTLVRAKGKNKVFNPSQDWRMFIPPLSRYEDYPTGWALFQDIILHMPFSIFATLAPTECKFKEMGEYLRDPVKKHYMISDLPPKITSLFMSTRNYIFHIFNIIERLAFCGMVTLGPHTQKEKDHVFIYLHRNLSIKNTKISQPGYLQITPNIAYPVDLYYLETLKDLDDYWFDLETTCLSTPLGSFSCSTMETEPEHVDKRQQLVNETQNKNVEEAVDDGHMPGDGLGAGGLDSSLFGHMKRNWNPPGGVKEGGNFFIQKMKRCSKDKPYLAPSNKRLKLIGPPSYVGEKIKVSKVKNMSRGEKRTLTDSKTNGPRKRIKRQHNPPSLPPPVATEAQPKPAPKPKKQRKPISDALDKETGKRRRVRKAEWSNREDTILLLCKVTSLFFMPKSKKLVVPYTVIRDILHKYVPESLKNKISVVCRSRLRYLLLDHPTFLNVSSLLGEALQDLELRKKYCFKEKLPLTKEAEWKQRFNGLFEDLFKKFTQGTIQTNVPELPDNQAELMEKYNVVVACADQEPRAPSVEPQNIEDIRRSVLHSLIFSALNNMDGKFNWNFTYNQIYRSFKDDCPKMLTDIEHYLSNHKIISKKVEHSKRYYFVPYRLSHKFDVFRSASLRPNIYEDSYSFIQDLETSSSNEPFVVKTDVSSIRIIGLLALVMQGHMDFKIKVPFSHILVNWDNKMNKSSTSVTQLLYMQENSSNKNDVQEVLHPSEFTFQLKGPYSERLHQKLDMQKEIIKSQRKLLPIDIGTAPTNLSEHFSSTDLVELEPLHRLILDGQECGVKKSEILRRYPSQRHGKVLELLKMLVDKNLVISAGTETQRYIDQYFSGPWVIQSFVIPKDEQLKACQLSQELMSGKEPIPEELEATQTPHHWKDVKFLLRAWKKPDGSLNRQSFKKILESVLSHITLTGCASKQGILDRYAASYQRFQILEILEILEFLDCIYTEAIPKSTTTTLDSSPDDFWDKESGDEEIFYLAHCDSMIKLGHFFKFLIHKHVY